MNYRQAILKRNAEQAVMFPFILLGRLAGKIFKLSTSHRVFLFFPNADIGGAVKVNADIVACIKDTKPLIIFSKKYKNNEFAPLFEVEGVRVLDLHQYVDNKVFHFVNFFFRGVLASWINKADDPIVFGGESLYFYKIIPHVKKATRIVELCHVSTWFNFSQAYVPYINCRVFSTPQIKREVEQQYRDNRVPERFTSRLHFVDNKVDIPEFIPGTNEQLEVLFVGRGAPQKRVHLIAAVAKRMHENGQNIHFSFVGDVEQIVPAEVQQYCTLYGNLGKEKLNEVYSKSDILLLTSAFEGLPIVVMDMMARGKIVVSTAVGGIPDYIVQGQTGFLIEDKEEDKIVSKGIEYLTELITNEPLRTTIQRKAYDFAESHFSEEHFCKAYRQLILGEDKKTGR